MVWVDSPKKLIIELTKHDIERQVELCDICEKEKPLTKFKTLVGNVQINFDGSWNFVGRCVCKNCSH